MSKQLHDLGRRLADEQDAALRDGALLRAAQAQYLTSLNRSARRTPSVVPKIGAVFALGAIAASLWLLLRPVEPVVLRYSVDSAAVLSAESRFVDAAATPRALRFSDGTELRLAPHSALRVLSLHGHGARVAIEQGALTVRVVHHGARTRWDFEAGPYRVRVVGTRFDLDWQREQGRFAIRMQEGKVRIEGPGLARELRAGESFVTPAAKATPAAGATTNAVQATATTEPANEGAASAEAAEPSALLQRAKQVHDTNPPEATRLYQALRTQHGGTRAAADAAFMLARLSGESPRAVSLLESYLREQPTGRYVDAALGRLVRTTRTLGDRAAARRYAEQYLSRYPSGPYAAEAHALLASP